MNPLNLLIGALVSLGVSALKKVPIVKNNPKIATAVLSTVIPIGVTALSAKGISLDVDALKTLALDAGTSFSAAVATHETVTHTVNSIKNGGET